MITLAGVSSLAAARRGSRSAWVRKKGDFKLRSTTLSQPLSGKASSSAPQAAPALLTRMSSRPSLARKASARARQPSTVETSCGSDRQRPPFADSSRAVASHTSALREEM